MSDKNDAPWNATLDEKVGWCMWNIMQIKKQLEGQSVPSKPWYTSVGIWVGIISVIVILGMIYVFYLVDKVGYGIILPQWMR